MAALAKQQVHRFRCYCAHMFADDDFRNFVSRVHEATLVKSAHGDYLALPDGVYWMGDKSAGSRSTFASTTRRWSPSLSRPLTRKPRTFKSWFAVTQARANRIGSATTCGGCARKQRKS